MSNASHPGAQPPRRPRWAGSWKYFGLVVGALALLVAAAVPAAAAELMRVTLVRHAESAGNASGLIDTSTPGPSITDKGREQAEAIADKLAVNNYDAIYASTMVRTQQTAAPMSQRLRLPVTVLPGLQEIEAGRFEGTPEANAANGYARVPLAWVFTEGGRNTRMPGSIDGNEFDARFDGALKTMYDKGDRNAIVYSHGGSIMFWTLMNANNLTMEQKLDLLRSHALKNTDYVVIEGNPTDGWSVVEWNGVKLAPEPTLESEVKLQTRTLSRQLTTAANQVTGAIATGNPATIVSAATKAASDAVFSVNKYVGAVSNKVNQEVEKRRAEAPTTPTQVTAALADKATNVTSLAPKAPTVKPAQNVVKTLKDLGNAVNNAVNDAVKNAVSTGNKVAPAVTAGVSAADTGTGTGNAETSSTGESGDAAA